MYWNKWKEQNITFCQAKLQLNLQLQIKLGLASFLFNPQATHLTPLRQVDEPILQPQLQLLTLTTASKPK